MSPVSEVEGYCLRWNNHHGTLIDVIQSLYQEQSFVDVTLTSDGKSIQVHRLVLCAVSPYFQELLSNDCDKQAIIFLKDIPFHHLQALVHYIYHGEVNIAEDQLADLLSTAESLQIKGLTDSDCKMNNIEQRNPDDLAESLRLNQIGQGINITETSCEASSPDSCEVAATIATQGPSPSLASATLSLPFMTTTSTTSLHSLQQPIYSTNPMASQANNNGVPFGTAPKLETENESSVASENEEWSDADLTGPTTPHQPQAHPAQTHQTQAHQTQAHQPQPHQTQAHQTQAHQTQTHQTQTHQTQTHQVGVTAAAVAAAAVAAQSFASTTPYPHVPWGESLAAAAAAAIASSSSLAGPSGALGVYNIQPPTTGPPVVAPARGKQRNSRRPSRPSGNTTTATLIQDKPYVCPRCGRCYSRRGALIQHQRYECGIEPQFSCPMCPYKIKRKDSLNRHIRNMHHNQNTN
ncbi:longitudinals lacking protein, isoforms N/O/W/X/Y isoform X1 [Daphnia magna]|uniref:longitudinals lacking protein, isoforms N/O/W/X/Y isoform X1 n=1 Tax=Daphnia magna TaxID=35525 RepID=UPI0006E80927|nr:longitudinals lacking protein, isoforms N/O/W/X/Y isoform X1 [Daphnia magna]